MQEDKIKNITKFLETPLILDNVFSDIDIFHNYTDALKTEKWGYNISEYTQGLYNPGPRFWGWTFYNDKTRYFSDDTPQWVLDLIPYLSKEKLPSELNLILNMICDDAHINGQTIGQDGEWHTDMDLTVMVMMNWKWEKDWGGEFQYKTRDGEVKTIEFKPGRVIVFDGQLWHRGLAPKDNNVLRMTMSLHFSYLTDGDGELYLRLKND